MHRGKSSQHFFFRSCKQVALFFHLHKTNTIFSFTWFWFQILRNLFQSSFAIIYRFATQNLVFKIEVLEAFIIKQAIGELDIHLSQNCEMNLMKLTWKVFLVQSGGISWNYLPKLICYYNYFHYLNLFYYYINLNKRIKTLEMSPQLLFIVNKCDSIFNQIFSRLFTFQILKSVHGHNAMT